MPKHKMLISPTRMVADQKWSVGPPFETKDEFKK